MSLPYKNMELTPEAPEAPIKEVLKEVPELHLRKSIEKNRLSNTKKFFLII